MSTSPSAPNRFGAPGPPGLPMAEIRLAVPGDLDLIVGLEQAGFPDPWPHELLAYEISFPGSIVLVAATVDVTLVDVTLAAASPRVTGYVSFRRGGGEAELLRLAVAPAARRLGTASALVSAGLLRLRREHVERCFLEVRTSNSGAIALYNSLGFERTGRRVAYYRDGSDALVYSRTP